MLVQSIGQLGDRRILAVLAKSLGVTLLAFALLGGATWWGVRAATDRLGDGLAAIVALVATLLAMWLAFRAVAIAVIGVSADEIVGAVEDRHYPGTTPRHVPLATGVAMGVRSAARAALVNVVLLPVYLILLATGIGTPLAFLAVNGWLLGRDLGDMVAVRHLSPPELRAWRRATAGRRFLLGVGYAALFLVPFANLLAPVLGAAMATHLFHRSRR